MTVAETKLVFEAGTAGLRLVSQLLALIQRARVEDQSDPQIAVLLAHLPGAAFSIAKDLVEECERLKQAFVDAGVDTGKTIAELQRDHWWWFSGKYKLVHRFLSYSNALSDVAGHAIDDFIAIARCRDQIKLVAEAFDDARKTKEEIDGILRGDVPVEQILEGMLSFARSLRDDVQKLV